MRAKEKRYLKDPEKLREGLLAQHAEQGQGKSEYFVLLGNLNADPPPEWAPFVETKFDGFSDSFCFAGTFNAPDNTTTLWDFTYSNVPWSDAVVVNAKSAFATRTNPGKPVKIGSDTEKHRASLRSSERLMTTMAKKGKGDPSLGGILDEGEEIGRFLIEMPKETENPRAWTRAMASKIGRRLWFSETSSDGNRGGRLGMVMAVKEGVKAKEEGPKADWDALAGALEQGDVDGAAEALETIRKEAKALKKRKRKDEIYEKENYYQVKEFFPDGVQKKWRDETCLMKLVAEGKLSFLRSDAA
jgi:hypothetical protein